MLSTLYDCMQQYHADIVSCGAGVVENGRIIKEEYGTNTLTEYDTDHALQYFLSGQKVNIGVSDEAVSQGIASGYTVHGR